MTQKRHALPTSCCGGRHTRSTSSSWVCAILTPFQLSRKDPRCCTLLLPLLPLLPLRACMPPRTGLVLAGSESADEGWQCGCGDGCCGDP